MEGNKGWRREALGWEGRKEGRKKRGRKDERLVGRGVTVGWEEREKRNRKDERKEE